ncbi:MAG: thiamine phosphate synthase [Candidatus Dormibacteraeota bacterium]|nr:thiamine phosphate synthase [Candidatus Dormibacteraeota bacterium]
MGRDGAWRRARLRAARLYVVSGARRGRNDLGAFLESVLRGGADIIQLREKDAGVADLIEWAAMFRAAASRHDALFILNDRADVALAVEADGVHLGQDDLPCAVARNILGPDAVIGLSTHNASQLVAAPDDADYFGVGPVFGAPTKPGPPATGLELVRDAAARERAGTECRPWFAIGGVEESTVGAVVSAGATRVAVVRAVDRDNAESAAAGLCAAL